MNKKFLSAILFGALMVTSTGTFVSCKDYDDDINEINATLTDLKSQIAALQTEVTNGNWVTSLVPAEGGFTVTFKDGKTYTIVSGKDGKDGQNGEKGDKGEAGKDGKGTEVTVKDGYWYLNGEKTEYMAVTEEDLKEVKVPYVNGANMWVFFDKDGNEVVSQYNANGAAYAVEVGGVWTLNIPDADGTMQTIALPTAASMISEIELLDDDFQKVQETNVINLLYWNAAKTTEWKGPRGNIADNTRTYSSSKSESESDLYNRIAPASVDASKLEFKLVDTEDKVAGITLGADRYLGTLSRAAENGLYYTGVVPGSYIGSEDSFKSGFLKGTEYTTKKALALKPATANYKSLFNVTAVLTADQTIELGKIKFDFSGSITQVGEDLSTTPDSKRQVKVGQWVSVSVEKEAHLYDMYLTAPEEDVALFGLEFSEDGRSFRATKSPDNVTDATIDLVVHTLSNKGGNDEIKETIITVEINRTLGEGVYDKQTKQPTKVDDKFLVSADKLKSSLGSDLNAWYASVKANTAVDVLEGIYNDEACTSGADLSAGQLKVVMSEKANTAVTETNIATKLNYLEFQLNINKTTKPLKIGKTYYAKLSFKDKNSDKELNTIVVPFELTKPELSTILVKESGVFLNGGNVAHAYMYHGDAKWNNAWSATSTDNAPSRYYIDRAFSDMHKKLSDAKMTTYVFSVNDGAGNVKNVEGKDTGHKTSYYATVKNQEKSQVDGEETRSYVQLISDTDENRKRDMAGYKKDLNVRFVGHYLDVNEDSWKYAQNYQFRVMSPILEGEAVASNNVVEVSATGKTQIFKESIWAKTYNNDVKYNIFKTFVGTTDNIDWYRSDIKNVTFISGNKNVFEVTVANPTDPQKANTTTGVKAVDSYIEVEGVSENTAKLKVAIDDIWGYTLNSSVDIKTTLNTGK